MTELAKLLSRPALGHFLYYKILTVIPLSIAIILIIGHSKGYLWLLGYFLLLWLHLSIMYSAKCPHCAYYKKGRKNLVVLFIGKLQSYGRRETVQRDLSISGMLRSGYCIYHFIPHIGWVLNGIYCLFTFCLLRQFLLQSLKMNVPSVSILSVQIIPFQKYFAIHVWNQPTPENRWWSKMITRSLIIEVWHHYMILLIFVGLNPHSFSHPWIRERIYRFIDSINNITHSSKKSSLAGLLKMAIVLNSHVNYTQSLSRVDFHSTNAIPYNHNYFCDRGRVSFLLESGRTGRKENNGRNYGR